MDVLDEAAIGHESVIQEQKGSFALLVTSNTLERFGYYGFRSLLILYVVESLGFSYVDAISNYGWFTSLVYLSSLFGGVFGDFVLKTKNSLWLGALISGVGCLLMMWTSEIGLYIGAIFIILGSGLYRPNVLSRTAKLFVTSSHRLDFKFTVLYMFTNLGAFLSAIFVGYLGETYGWHWGFLLAGLAYLAAGILFFIDKDGTRSIEKSSVGATYKNVRSPRNVALIAIPIVCISFFWFSYEFGYTTLLPLADSFDSLFGYGWEYFRPSQSVNAILILVFGLFFLLIVRKKAFSSVRMIAIGMFIFAFSWLIAFGGLWLVNSSGYWLIYILFQILTAISEVLIAAVILAAIGKHVPLKVMGTIFGSYLVITALLNRFSGFIASEVSSELISPIVFAVGGVIIGAGLFALSFAFRKPKKVKVEGKDLLDS